MSSSDSGKSTILKQMKIINKSGFSQDELEAYRPVVYRNVLDSVHGVLVHMRKVRMECATLKNALLADKILAYHMPGIKASLTRSKMKKSTEGDEDEEFSEDVNGKGREHDDEEFKEFDPAIAEAIHLVWKDVTFQKVMDENSSDFYLMDSAGYFFTEILRIGTPGYIPNETDVLRARKKTLRITEERFLMGPFSMHMFDLNCQRSERKWIHCFEDVRSVIFCAALSEYYQPQLEEKTQNRMTESLVLFDYILNSRWLLRTDIILFLNKFDVFKVKLPKVPLERYFPEYTGGPDINKAAKYVLLKFMHANQASVSVPPRSVYPHHFAVVAAVSSLDSPPPSILCSSVDMSSSPFHPYLEAG
ncbi:hypothetical protein DXG01_007020 [Tephrocybe rancida]|nr:hypothetical protein DXG01_007020 [Tephrocybe rancida]